MLKKSIFIVLLVICIIGLNVISTASVPVIKMTYLSSPIYEGPYIVDIPSIENIKVNRIELAFNLIAHHEKFSNKRYRDSNGWAIGYGDNHCDKKTISRLQASMLLIDRIEDLDEFIADNINIAINEHQKASLISFVYNVGKTAFLNSTLYTELNKGNCHKIPNQMKRWVYATKKGKTVKLKGLCKRRVAEATLWNTM